MGRAQGRRLAVQALAAGHPTHGADGRSRRDRGDDPRGVRLELEVHVHGRRVERAAAGRPGSSAPARATSSRSSTTSRRTRSSPRRRTAPPTRASCSAAPTSGRVRRTRMSAEMVNAFNSAVTAGVDGIAFAPRRPARVQRADVQKALRPRSRSSPTTPTPPATPGSPTSARTCSSPARRWAQHIASLVPSGDVALFIATPGSLNIQPRIDGALATLKSHPSIKPHVHGDRRGAHRRSSRRSTPT